MRIKSVNFVHMLRDQTSKVVVNGKDGCRLEWIAGVGLLYSKEGASTGTMFPNIPGVKSIEVELKPQARPLDAGGGAPAEGSSLQLDGTQPIRRRRGRPPKVPQP